MRRGLVSLRLFLYICSMEEKIDISQYVNRISERRQKPMLKKDVANYFKVNNDFDIVEVGDREDSLFIEYNGKAMPLTLFYTLVCVYDGNITAEIFNKHAI